MARLPPLNAIRTFEAAARHSSFKRAAEELNVTHGAVSRQVSLLEDWLGTTLFRRLNRRVVLTEEGRALLGEVEPALARIALAAASLSRQRESTQLIVNAPPTFTMRWLIPRLPKFLRENEDIEIRLTTSIKPVDFSTGTYDLAIRRGSEALTGLTSQVFLPEMLLPVCSKDLFDDISLEKPEDLRRQVLIHTETAPMAWPQWLAMVGCEGLRSERSLRFEEMFYALEAAANSLGIALAPAALVADDVLAGRLVMPFRQACSREHDYRAIFMPLAGKASAIDRFCGWIGLEGEQSVADVAELLGGGRQRRRAASARVSLSAASARTKRAK